MRNPAQIAGGLVALALVQSLALTAPAHAGPALGLGISLTFGPNGATPGAGARLFWDDEDHKITGSLGLDYQFNGGGLRPNIGAAYLGEGFYLGGDVGYTLNSGQTNIGASGGWADTSDDSGTPDD